MSKLPFSYRFRAWLLQYWFTSFEGGMVRDVWLREGATLERERIIKLLRNRESGEVSHLGAALHDYFVLGKQEYLETAVALIKGETDVA